jgi:signal transduction histidine kinase
MVYLSGTDVTDLHEALEELARRSGELERSNAELDRFAGVVSHDLRSSLTSVAGFLLLLERRHGDELSEPARELLASAGEASARMRSLVDDLLAYARVGHSGRAPEPVDVGALARRVAAAVAPGAALETGALPVVHALPREFEQLLANLIGNAAKFVAPGTPPRIRLDAQRTDDAWRFELADNGIGIEARHADRIFGMFQRLHGGDAYPGTGIGLAIAAKVVERAGGRIWVRPGSEGGSVFAFTWPA